MKPYHLQECTWKKKKRAKTYVSSFLDIVGWLTCKSLISIVLPTWKKHESKYIEFRGTVTDTTWKQSSAQNRLPLHTTLSGGLVYRREATLAQKRKIKQMVPGIRLQQIWDLIPST